MASADTPPRGLGYRPDPPDRRDYRYQAPRRAGLLPPRVDLRQTGRLPPVWDQGPHSSCVPHGLLRCFAYCHARAGRGAFDPSRLFSWYYTRALEGTTQQDAGCAPRNGLKALARQGVCAEGLWPGSGDFRRRPGPDAQQDGLRHQLLVYERLPRSLTGMRRLLAVDGYPFVLGMAVYESFCAVGADGLVPVPRPHEDYLGGHLVACTGYDDGLGCLLCDNSWGAGWGMAGRFYLPYALALDDSFCDDFWTLRTVE